VGWIIFHAKFNENQSFQELLELDMLTHTKIN